MRNSQKGFAPIIILIVAVAVLVVGGGTYFALRNQAPKQDDSTVQNTLDETNAEQNENWETYRNTAPGYEVKYPANWQIEQLRGGSVRIVNPVRKGKDDTDQPTEAVMIQVKQNTLPCKGSNWEVGFGLVSYKTACLNSKVFMTMVAFDEQGKNIEEQILSTFAFTNPTNSGTPSDSAPLSSWKTYLSENYGLEFKYPSTWFVRPSNDGLSFSLTKSPTTPLAKAFASFYISDLNAGKEGAPHYVTPQEYFDYYFGNDSRSGIGGQPALQFLQLGQAPVVHRVVVGDNRYVIYTSDRQLSFILYPGSTQNPTEYASSDDALMEQVVKTLTLTNSSKQFVKVALPLPVSTSESAPYISSITPLSGPIGTIVEIRGNDLSGFEGDLDIIFERSDGKKIMLTDTFGDYPKTGGSLIKVIAKEPCQQGETIYGRYSGIPAQCNYIAMTPGTYKVYAEPWGKKSNVVNFTITQGTNTIIKNEWGISFSKPSNWDITSNTGGIVELKQVSGEWVGDTIDISYITGANITTTDAKFGSVTYYWNESGQKWMKIGQSEKTGENESPVPATTYIEYPYAANTFPVFVGANRWLTLIIPLSHTTFLKLHITGSGQTQPLKDVLGTIKKI
ncbi:MAG: hypothetical protein A3G59_00490 [Candidatus Taylorbacteria bacterium RIFCSPLOWO2_12_FULL_47_20]|uniref:IPT/TIG domain-containing protein n=2 Tax=Candidatus Tayloriibacteriota TaxID=1817919 RepID=A0A1G2P4F3_9BACT|nr:MAG: hypothetical protein A3H68_01885 [Candidatus Taylorbacteria bacterium RIFCSPLOWO2_02_FULL_46_40]OHA43220.1 MAG: hypothetical protein A3G59_00490 [Candidatus Taylorbacteria bacterium RIFCSPLOWO2_12_FULL_47_20]